MKDSGIPWIGEIPEDWKIGKVKHCFDRKNEKAQQDNPIVLSLARSGVKIRDLSSNEGQIAESYYNYNPVEPGDLLLNPMDLYSGANCSISEVSGVISPAYVNLRFRGNNNPKYFDYYFKTQYWGMAFFAHGKGISFDNRWTMNADTIFNYWIPVPSIAEQWEISEFLDRKCGEVDEMVALQEQVIQELKAYKQSIITEAVTKGLNPNTPMKPSGINWIGEIPEHWDIIPLKYFLTKNKNNLRVGPFGSALKGGDFQPEGVWVYNQRTVLDNNFTTNDTFITDKKYEELFSFNVYPNDVLITTRGSIGKISIVPENAPNGILHPCIIRFEIDFSKINKSILLHIFNESNLVLDQMRFKSNSTTIDVLYSYTLKEIKLPLIPENEQREIADYLDRKCADIDALIALKQQKIEDLKEYKKSLIYEYVTGKKQVFPN